MRRRHGDAEAVGGLAERVSPFHPRPGVPPVDGDRDVAHVEDAPAPPTLGAPVDAPEERDLDLGEPREDDPLVELPSERPGGLVHRRGLGQVGRPEQVHGLGARGRRFRRLDEHVPAAPDEDAAALDRDDAVGDHVVRGVIQTGGLEVQRHVGRRAPRGTAARSRRAGRPAA